MNLNRFEERFFCILTLISLDMLSCTLPLEVVLEMVVRNIFFSDLHNLFELKWLANIAVTIVLLGCARVPGYMLLYYNIYSNIIPCYSLRCHFLSDLQKEHPPLRALRSSKCTFKVLVQKPGLILALVTAGLVESPPWDVNKRSLGKVLERTQDLVCGGRLQRHRLPGPSDHE